MKLLIPFRPCSCSNSIGSSVQKQLVSLFSPHGSERCQFNNNSPDINYLCSSILQYLCCRCSIIQVSIYYFVNDILATRSRDRREFIIVLILTYSSLKSEFLENTTNTMFFQLSQSRISSHKCFSVKFNVSDFESIYV